MNALYFYDDVDPKVLCLECASDLDLVTYEEDEDGEEQPILDSLLKKLKKREIEEKDLYCYECDKEEIEEEEEEIEEEDQELEDFLGVEISEEQEEDLSNLDVEANKILAQGVEISNEEEIEEEAPILNAEEEDLFAEREEEIALETPKKRGRPVGSKNAPKDPNAPKAPKKERKKKEKTLEELDAEILADYDL